MKWILILGVCVLPFVQPFPRETLEHIIKDYTEGIEALKKTTEEIHFVEHPDLAKNLDTEAVELKDEFDFIVIGAGSAGSVIANRLSEVPEWKVLVLEAGKPESKIGQIPALANMMSLTDYNWGYKTEPQVHSCLGMTDHQCVLPKGKSLGGSSSINDMMYVRGNELDYDRWADNDLRGWCYNDVLPYFKKSEDCNIEHFDNKYHRKGGPRSVEDLQYASPLAKSFLEAGHELGIKHVDYNGKEQLGFSYPQVNTKHGKRHSTSGAYLEPAVHRKNLVVYPSSQVTKILIGDHTKEVKGVEFLQTGKHHIAKAKKEVIVAAGAINSPQILMLSGIGPKAHLEHLEIPCKSDLHVGQNLQDHIGYPGLNFIVNNETHFDDNSANPENLKVWLTEGKGPLAKTANVEGLGYIKTKHSKEVKDYPDIEFIFTVDHLDEKSGAIIKKTLGLSDEMYNALWKPLEGHHIWNINPVLLHPKSKGQVALKSKNPFQWPAIFGNYLTDADDHDVQTIVEGIKKAIEVSKTKSFEKHGSKLIDSPVPGCEKHDHGTDEYWRCAVRHIATSISRPVGTCKMGTAADKEAVVDEHLKVHGVKGLRVADSSVIPFALSAHTATPEVMIGEKAADLIKETWK